jgi:5-formyltetrahydrofolate cyclo-ligase
LRKDLFLLPPIAPFLSPKAVLREKLKAERKRVAATRPDAARHAARLFMDNIPLSAGAVVALYHPIKDELDTAPLAEALLERGARLALPVAGKTPAPLVFRAYALGDDLIKGRHGVMVPAPAQASAIPDIVVAPLLGFTRAGARLGYGGGYYDRTLRALRAAGRALVVGYGFGAQEIDALPTSPLDERLDWIVTEREAIRVGAP